MLFTLRFHLLPALIAFSVVILFPFVQSLRLSLYKYTIEMERPAFVGLANFTKLLADPANPLRRLVAQWLSF